MIKIEEGAGRPSGSLHNILGGKPPVSDQKITRRPSTWAGYFRLFRYVSKASKNMPSMITSVNENCMSITSTLEAILPHPSLLYTRIISKYVIYCTEVAGLDKLVVPSLSRPAGGYLKLTELERSFPGQRIRIGFDCAAERFHI